MKISPERTHIARLLLLAILLVGCELASPLDIQSIFDAEDIVYSESIQPLIFDRYCVNCHVGADAARGLRLDTWTNVMAGSDFGEAVIPFDDDNSLMIKMASRLVGGPHPMELGADTLNQVELNFLRRWIKLGARFDGPLNATIPNSGTVPFAATNSPLLFVPNREDALISVIDVDAKLVIRTIDLTDADVAFNFTPNARPHDVEIEPDGSAIYASLLGDNAVIKISVDNPDVTGQLVGQAPFQSPGLLALNAQSDQLFVSRSLSAVSPPQSVGIIERTDMSLREIEVGSPRPHALEIDPAGNFAYTASLAGNQLIIVDANNDGVTFTNFMAPFNGFAHFALSLDGTRLAASAQQFNQVRILDTSEPPGVRLIGSTEVSGNQPWQPVWTPDGQRIYVGNKEDHTVSVINAGNLQITQTISGNGLAEPHGSAVTPDGAFVFISNNNTTGAYTPRYNFGNNENTGTVVVINTATNEIEKVIEVGRFPAGLSKILP